MIVSKRLNETVEEPLCDDVNVGIVAKECGSHVG